MRVRVCVSAISLEIYLPDIDSAEMPVENLATPRRMTFRPYFFRFLSPSLSTDPYVCLCLSTSLGKLWL